MATNIHCKYCNCSQPRLRSLYPAYDFDISREWFVHEPPLPCDFPKIRRFQANISQSRDSNFAGPHCDVRRGDWVEGHLLGNDGSLTPALRGQRLENVSDDLHHAVPIEADAHRAVQVIKHIGPAAGKLYLSNSKVQDNAEESLGYISSRFCLDSRFFLTAAHWSATEEINNGIFQPHNDIVIISIAGQSDSWQNDEDEMVRSAYLIYRDVVADIALFHLDPGMSDFPRSLSYASLQALPSDISTSVVERIWAIGYAGSEDERSNEYLCEQRKIITDGKALEIFRNSKENLPFERVYHPYRRILFFGRLGEKHATDQDVWYHSVPGWFGMSGSMMDVLKDKNGKWCFNIIGTFRGGVSKEEPNQLTTFTVAGMETIAEKICNALSNSNPV